MTSLEVTGANAIDAPGLIEAVVIGSVIDVRRGPLVAATSVGGLAGADALAGGSGSSLVGLMTGWAGGARGTVAGAGAAVFAAVDGG